MVVGLISWLITPLHRLRGLDVTGSLARHRGRAALVSTNLDTRSCCVAKQLAHAHGHRRLDWIVLLDPVESVAMA